MKKLIKLYSFHRTILILSLIVYSEVETYSGLIEWESGTLYPTCLSFLQSAAINKNPDPSLKTQLNSALTLLGTWLISSPMIVSWLVLGSLFCM